MDRKNVSRAGAIPQELASRFGRLRRRIRWLNAAKGIALLVVAFGIAFGLAVLLDRIFFLRTTFRFLLFAASAATLLLFVAVGLVLPALRRYSARRLAVTVEDRYPELGDSVLSTVELSEEVACGTTYTSRELVAAQAKQTLDRSRPLSFQAVAPLSAIRMALLLAVAASVGLGVYWALFPDVASNVFARIAQPWSPIDPYTRTKLEVTPKSVRVPRGTDVTVDARATGTIPTRARLFWRHPRQRWQREQISASAPRLFSHRFKNILQPILYRIRAGDARTDTFFIEPVDLPAVVGVSLRLEFPAYTGRKPSVVNDTNGAITALRGSRVTLMARTNKPCSFAVASVYDAFSLPMTVRRQTLTSPSFEVLGDGAYSFRLVDREGFENEDRILYPIRALPDEAPTIQIVRPAETSISAPPSGFVLVQFRAADDFSIESMSLAYTASAAQKKEQKDIVAEDIRTGVLPVTLQQPGAPQVTDSFPFDLAELPLRTGDVLTFHLEAVDNDTISGPKVGRSISIAVRIISEEDAFRQIENEQLNLQRRLRALIKRQTEGRKLVESLRGRLAEKGELSSTEEQQLSAARTTQQSIEEADRSLAEDFGKTTEAMQENPLIQTRSILRMTEMKQALEGLAAREMPTATRQVRDAETTRQTAQREQSMQDASTTQQEIIEALEQIDQEFSKMLAEQRLLSLASAAKALAQQQERNVENTQGATEPLEGKFPESLSENEKQLLKKLVDEERKLRERLDDLQDRLRRTAKQMQFQKSEEADIVEAAIKKLQEDAVEQDMDEAIEQLRLNHLYKSVDPQKRAAKSLAAMAQNLEQSHLARLRGEFQNVPQRLREFMMEIDRLIERQGELLEKTRTLSAGTEADPVPLEQLSVFEEVQAGEADLTRRTTNFRDYLRDLFANLVMVNIDPITPLGRAIDAMTLAVGHLERLHRDPAAEAESIALDELIRAREELSKAIAKMMAEADMMQMLEQMSLLEQMIEKQRLINDDTKDVDKTIRPNEPLQDNQVRAVRLLSQRQSKLADLAGGLGDVLKKVSELMTDSAQRLKRADTGKETQKIQAEILESLERLLFQMQMQMQAMGQGAGGGGGGGGGNRSGLNLPPRLQRPPLPGGNDQWSKLPARLLPELHQAWTEKFPPEFREILSQYYKRLSDEQSPY